MVTPPKVTPPKGTPPAVLPVNVAPEAIVPEVTPPQLLGEVYVGAPVATQASTRPLPTAAEAGETGTTGQMVIGSLAAMAGLTAWGTSVMLRRRHGDS